MSYFYESHSQTNSFQSCIQKLPVRTNKKCANKARTWQAHNVLHNNKQIPTIEEYTKTRYLTNIWYIGIRGYTLHTYTVSSRSRLIHEHMACMR